jgi:hypothetical protein
MRLIPQKERMLNPKNSEAFEELRQRQGNFNANMCKVLSWEISALYTQSDRVPIGLHDAVMAIPSPNFPESQLFHCADKSTVKAPCTMWVHPQDETHARAVIAGLIPYLRHKIRKQRPEVAVFSADEHKYMSRHLYRFFTEAAVKRSMRCEWSEEEGGVTSQDEKQVMSLLNVDKDFNFQAIAEVKVEDGPTGALPPAQYNKAGEDDSISTFRKTKASVKKVTMAQSYSQQKTDDSSTIKSKTTDDGSSIATGLTTTSKKSKTSINSKRLTITSELTSSMDQTNQNVSAMQVQFIALMQKIDIMNNRMGVLEVGPQSGQVQGIPGAVPIPGLEQPNGNVPSKSTLPSSSHPPEKGDEKTS